MSNRYPRAVNDTVVDITDRITGIVDAVADKIEEAATAPELDFSEELFVSAFVGNVNETLSVLAAQGFKFNKAWATKIFKKVEVQEAIKRRGDNPFRDELLLTSQEMQAIMSYKIMNATNEKTRLAYIKLYGSSLGMFIDKKEIKVDPSENWLDAILTAEREHDAGSSEAEGDGDDPLDSEEFDFLR